MLVQRFLAVVQQLTCLFVDHSFAITVAEPGSLHELLYDSEFSRAAASWDGTNKEAVKPTALATLACFPSLPFQGHPLSSDDAHGLFVVLGHVINPRALLRNPVNSAATPYVGLMGALG
jgi:hypothetical protein